MAVNKNKKASYNRSKIAARIHFEELALATSNQKYRRFQYTHTDIKSTQPRSETVAHHKKINENTKIDEIRKNGKF